MAHSTRRDFLKTAAGVSLAAGLGGTALADAGKRTATDWVTLGRSNVKVTRLAFGTGTYSGAAQRALARTASRAWCATPMTAASVFLRRPKAITACRKCWLRR
ncbi:MAG: twin-arginine translocation signal domain-containing protein [Bryobacteraceae bacterium]